MQEKHAPLGDVRRPLGEEDTYPRSREPDGNHDKVSVQFLIRSNVPPRKEKFWAPGDVTSSSFLLLGIGCLKDRLSQERCDFGAQGSLSDELPGLGVRG